MKSTAGLSAGLRAEVETQLEATDSSESQVVRKALVQSSFRRLINLERTRLLMSSADRAPEPARPTSLKSLLTDATYRAFVIEPDDLSRGRLLETTVELEADPVFEVATAAGVVLDVVKSNPELFGGALTELQNVAGAYRVLDQLLSGLVPLRGRCVDWVCIVHDGRQVIVRSSLVPPNGTDEFEVIPLCIVGVAQRDLFWTDIRRVVFSRSRYQVLCRVGRDGVHEQWTPIKLADVFRSLAPNLAVEWDNAGDVMMRAIADSVSIAGATESAHEYPVLERFARELAKAYGGDEATAAAATVATVSGDAASATAVDGRDAFRKVAKVVGELLDVEIDGAVIADTRSRVVTATFRGEADQRPSTGAAPTRSQPTRYIDAEMVAIYW